jgi:hypothetical protein
MLEEERFLMQRLRWVGSQMASPHRSRAQARDLLAGDAGEGPFSARARGTRHGARGTGHDQVEDTP